MAVTVELTLEQIAVAIRHLSPEERLDLFRLVIDQATLEQSRIGTASQVSEHKLGHTRARAELDRELAIAAEALLDDYTSDKELTAFSALDAEDFYAEK